MRIFSRLDFFRGADPPILALYAAGSVVSDIGLLRAQWDNLERWGVAEFLRQS
jgi:hypothetical protein